MISDTISIFSLDSGKEFAEKVAANLNLPISKHEEREFEDGEHKIRSLESVRGKDVYIIQSLYSDVAMSVNDKLCRLLFFVGALKESGSKKVTLLIPYLCYARKDRKTKPRDPVTTKYLAQMIESVGTDHVVTLDVHNLQAFQNSFRCYSDHLEAKVLFADYFSELKEDDIVIMSPDAGGMKRADEFRLTLGRKTNKELPLIFMEKKRSAGEVSGTSLVGEVKNKTVIIVDDLISSGTTLARAAVACKEAGARRVAAAATHGVFSSKAKENLLNPALDKVIITNSIPYLKINQELVESKIKILDIAPLIAECIKRLHTNNSIVELTEK
ncbi:MAG TPA: ribose-phosphate pyrophosphokinase [Cytophagaceae bacterium]